MLSSGYAVEFVAAQADLPQRAVVCITLYSYSAPTLTRVGWARLLSQRLSGKEGWKGRTKEKHLQKNG
jgi:hypothetical protein